MFSMSCASNQDDQTMGVQSDKFTYDFHFAEQAEKEVTERGLTDYENFKQEFVAFPWLEQLDRANELGGTSATITAHDHSTLTELWVSIAGDRNQYGYIVGYNAPRTIKGGLFRKERTTKWVTMYTTEDTTTIFNLYNLFFKGDTIKLIGELKRLEFFGEVESQVEH